MWLYVLVHLLLSVFGFAVGSVAWLSVARGDHDGMAFWWVGGASGAWLGWFLAGKLLAAAQASKAIADLSEAIRLSPNDAAAYLWRGEVYLQKGDMVNAIIDLSKAIKLDPEDATAYVRRGEAYQQNGKPDSAAENFAKAKTLMG